MSTSITGRLKKPAREFTAGEFTGFSFNINKKVKIKQEDKWTTYSVAIFSKSQPQIEFYRSSLVENCVVTCEAKDLIVESREYEGKDYLSIKLVYAELTEVFTMSEQSKAPAQNYQQPAQQAAPQQRTQQAAPRQQPAAPQPAQSTGFDDFDDTDIPF